MPNYVTARGLAVEAQAHAERIGRLSPADGMAEIARIVAAIRVKSPFSHKALLGLVAGSEAVGC